MCSTNTLYSPLPTLIADSSLELGLLAWNGPCTVCDFIRASRECIRDGIGHWLSLLHQMLAGIAERSLDDGLHVDGYILALCASSWSSLAGSLRKAKEVF